MSTTPARLPPRWTTLADLRIVKRSTPAAVTVGQNLTYDSPVTNLGPSAAQAVQVIDTLPGAFVLAGVSSTQGSCAALPCALGTIPAGGSATVSIQGTVTTTAAFDLINTATVASTTPLTNTADDTSTVTTTLGTSADLALTKIDLVDPVQADGLHLSPDRGKPGPWRGPQRDRERQPAGSGDLRQRGQQRRLCGECARLRSVDLYGRGQSYGR